MNYAYSEPSRFTEQNEPLDNYHDLASRTRVIEKGLYSTPLGFDIRVEVSLESLDDLVLQCEQDYYLKKFIAPHFEILQKDSETLHNVLRLTELYLTVSPYETPKALQVKRYALSCLSLIGGKGK